MKKEIKLLLVGSSLFCSLVIAGCSATPSTASETTQTQTKDTVYHKNDVTGPAASFDWDAKMPPLTKYEQTYVESNSGKTVKMPLSRVKKAAEDLAEKKKSISDSKVQEALKLVDAVFVNQENFDALLHATTTSNQEEFFDKLWNGYMVKMLTESRPTFSNDAEIEFQGVTYPIKVYGPMYLKVNTNSLGKAGAYTLEDYKVDGDTVYLKFQAPKVDLYQYEVQASYQRDNQAFFEGLIQESQKIGQSDFSKALLLKLIYRLAAIGFKSNLGVNLEGMDYLPRNTHYLAIKVDDKGKATIDDANLANLLQIDLKTANEANKAKFE